MRAAAYYFLVLDWGAVPIIYNNSSQLGDTSIRKNDVADVWKFIISDLTWSKIISPLRRATGWYL